MAIQNGQTLLKNKEKKNNTTIVNHNDGINKNKVNLMIHNDYNFKKHITYTDKEGNWINDRYIKIYIEYHDDYDYEHN